MYPSQSHTKIPGLKNGNPQKQQRKEGKISYAIVGTTSQCSHYLIQRPGEDLVRAWKCMLSLVLQSWHCLLRDIESVLYWHKNRHVNQLNWTEDPAINPQIYKYLTFYKESKNTHTR